MVFEAIFNDTMDLVNDHGLLLISVPRRRPPTRISEPAPAHQPDTVELHFRKAYYEFFDSISTNLADRFGESSKADLKEYEKLEQMLMTGMFLYVLPSFIFICLFP